MLPGTLNNGLRCCCFLLLGYTPSRWRHCICFSLFHTYTILWSVSGKSHLTLALAHVCMAFPFSDNTCSNLYWRHGSHVIFNTLIHDLWKEQAGIGVGQRSLSLLRISRRAHILQWAFWDEIEADWTRPTCEEPLRLAVRSFNAVIL